MAFLPANKRHGGFVVRPEQPQIEEWRDVYLVPISHESGVGGIYDRSGNLVPASGFYRGPDHQLVMQQPTSQVDLGPMAAEAPDETYIFGGLMHAHYGHFLCSTLSRLWSIPAYGSTRPKILTVSGEEPYQWFAHPHIEFAFRNLGLSPSDFVRFERVTHLRRLLIPLPSFEEEHFAHPAFAALCHHVSESSRAGTPGRNATPAYVSKAKLSTGVWRFVNEEAVTDTLARHGVDIVFPEQLSLSEQIQLFAGREIICGAVGSALHTTIFTPNPPKIIAYNRSDVMVSNYLLMDAVNETEATYVTPEAGVVNLPPSDGFSLNVEIIDPQTTAEDLLRLIDLKQRGSTRVLSDFNTQSNMTLDAIGTQQGTDKASGHHNFLVFYERFFAELRTKADLKLLEIGVYDGASVRTWERYFSHARIVGIDISPGVQQHATNRVTIEIADQSNVATLTRLALDHGPFDILIDDGSHQWDHQITSFRTLYPFLKPGGYYIMEDIDTSYGSFVDTYRGIGSVPAAKYLQKLQDYVVGDAALPLATEEDAFIRSYAPLTQFLAFYRRTCLIRKRPA